MFIFIKLKKVKIYSVITPVFSNLTLTTKAASSNAIFPRNPKNPKKLPHPQRRTLIQLRIFLKTDNPLNHKQS